MHYNFENHLQVKKENEENEAIQNELVGQAHLEHYALKMFLYADNEDRASRFGKYVVFIFVNSIMMRGENANNSNCCPTRNQFAKI